ncbi:MAG: flagellar basal body L-ring protein FlgH [Alphaproteobacteria bacterium]|nr:flagellar basal body L-ring protein FlgH [Alphaproteobacteria bacterium]MDE2337631.1 flagellar basal body L-ring protein FlgH [Alphaproteobacteria bacterium]
MKTSSYKKILKAGTCLAAALLLGGCGIGQQISEIGKTPQVTQITNPVMQPGYRPITMPMPQPVAANTSPNSLWQPQRQTFFKDQRAAKIGDIVTVTIAINDTADLQNETDRSKTGSETDGMPNFFGAETKILPNMFKGVDPSKLVGLSSDSASNGTGKIQRSEAINLKLAATVMQVLPNGNFVIQGHQQVVVNNEMRNLALEGIIRPEDILNDNTISYDKIAEARITYGGKGLLTNLQQPSYGQQFFDAVFPF